MMKFFVQNILVCFMILASSKVYAQELPIPVLPKSNAVAIMLENNFGIKLANNNLEVAENNTDLLNSGYLPSVFFLGGANFDRTNTTVDFGGALNQDGTVRPDVVIDGAETTRYNASINMDYLLFDGLGRYYNFKQLKEEYNLTELQARETIENTMLQLFSVYYEVARIEENLSVLEEALDISRKREKRAEYQFEYGQVNKLEVLNAQVDIVTDSINIMTARQDLRNVQRDLNVVLARELEDLRSADTTVTFVSKLLMDSYIEKASENNVSLLQVNQDILITDYQIKQAKGLFLPTIGLTGSYGWNQSINPASAFFPSTTNKSNSLAVGANLRWNLFDGGTSVIGYKNAKIALDSQQLLKEQLEQQVYRDIRNAQGNYTNALAVYRLQAQNVATTTANFERSEERLKLGQISSIEFRQAQLNLLNALTTKNAAKYTAKLAELQVLQLTGQLLNVNF